MPAPPSEPLTICILANGVIADTGWLSAYLDKCAAVIAADGGLGHLVAAGRWPHVVIGDLDSLPDAALESLTERGTTIIRYPEDKNATDLELALLYAAEQYPGATLLVFGAFGGRVDQTLANVLLLAHPQLVDRRVILVEANESAWLVTDRTTIQGRAGDTVSLLPLGGPVHIVATTGLRWPLDDEELAFGPARGISNELVADEVTIQLSDGMLVCIHGRG